MTYCIYIYNDICSSATWPILAHAWSYWSGGQEEGQSWWWRRWSRKAQTRGLWVRGAIPLNDPLTAGVACAILFLPFMCVRFGIARTATGTFAQIVMGKKARSSGSACSRCEDKHAVRGGFRTWLGSIFWAGSQHRVEFSYFFSEHTFNRRLRKPWLNCQVSKNW